MSYEELETVVDIAWNHFYDILCANGIKDIERLGKLLDRKDCYNDVFDCVIQVAPLESEQ